MLSIDQIRERLDDRFRLLTGGSRTALPRHQTLQAAIEWSYDQLTPAEQRLLRPSSVFAGGWTFEILSSMLAADADEFVLLDELSRLVDKSLVIGRTQRRRANRATRCSKPFASSRRDRLKEPR